MTCPCPSGCTMERLNKKRLSLPENTEKLYPFQLSGGMARRVLVSTALITDAKLIIADEPTPGMSLEQALEALYGKTTLAMLMAGYLKPTEGEILLDGKSLPQKGVCPVQLIHQHPEKAVNPRWRLKRVLEESGRIQEDVLDDFGIERAWIDRFPSELSGGELQRFCIARALMSGADFLICDEISTMLDVVTQTQIWNVVLKEVEKRDMGIIAITHNRYLARQIAVRIYDLSKQEYL